MSSLPLILQTPIDKTILAGGGFSNATQIGSPNPDTDTCHLEASPEEADTIPPVNNQASNNFVVSHDTDVAVLLLVHSDQKKGQKIWIKR